MDVVVVGGGIVGLSCAWFLRDAGHEVTVLDRGEPFGAASRGNAGAICPSLCTPLAAPGQIREALANMTRPDAALHVSPRYAPRMAGFLTRFAAAATRDRHEAAWQSLASLSRDAAAAFDELESAGAVTGIRHDGYVFVANDVAAARSEHAAVTRMAEVGACEPPGEILDSDGVRELEPLLSDHVRAGFVLPGERWVEPSLMIDGFIDALRASGVDVRTGVAVRSVRAGAHTVQVVTDEDAFEPDLAVVAAGVWSRGLLKHLGLRLPMQPGKGYSFSVRPDGPLNRVVYFPDPHVMTSPAGERMRVGGTMEFDGTTDRFAPGRVDAIVHGLRPWFRDVDLDARYEEWVGARPMTPDGLPVIGPVPEHPNVFVATGHCMLGLTLGPVTGRIVARMAVMQDPGLDVVPFAPDRF